MLYSASLSAMPADVLASCRGRREAANLVVVGTVNFIRRLVDLLVSGL